jgi:glycosyltransferase involved in cell wall biosynthesis
MFTVSAIVPNYNHASFLRQRLDSVLSQSFSVYEIIILDDCSTDNSLDVIQQYSKHPLVKHIIVNEKNSGSPFLQWQKGIELASGDWIWIAESDDYAHPDFLLEMKKLSEQFIHAGFLYCDSNILDERDEVISNFETLKNTRIKTQKWSTTHANNGLKELLDFMLVYGTVNNSSAALFKASTLKAFSITDPLLRYTGDKLVFCNMLLETDIAYSNAKYNYYRAGSGKPKHTNDYFNYAFENFQILVSVFKRQPTLPYELIKKVITQNIQINFLTQPHIRLTKYLNMLMLSPKLFLYVVIVNFKRILN